MTVVLLGGLIATGIVAVIVFRLLAVRRLGRNRKPLDFQEIHHAVADQVSLDTLTLVFEMLGDAYGVEPRLIRPNDPLKHLFDSDSWTLDMGTEKLNKWLQSIGMAHVDAQPTTVLDLLLLVEARHKSN